MKQIEYDTKGRTFYVAREPLDDCHSKPTQLSLEFQRLPINKKIFIIEFRSGFCRSVQFRINKSLAMSESDVFKFIEFSNESHDTINQRNFAERTHTHKQTHRKEHNYNLKYGRFQIIIVHKLHTRKIMKQMNTNKYISIKHPTSFLYTTVKFHNHLSNHSIKIERIGPLTTTTKTIIQHTYLNVPLGKLTCFFPLLFLLSLLFAFVCFMFALSPEKWSHKLKIERYLCTLQKKISNSISCEQFSHLTFQKDFECQINK